jgi:hypothetical protein
MKKLFLLVTIVTITVISCGKKTQNDDAPVEITAAEGSKVVKVDLTDFDKYEGKIVHASTGQWYLIKEGARWRTNSIESTDDYLKKVTPGPDYVEENVPIEKLQQFPEVGELLPKLEFKKDERKIAP